MKAIFKILMLLLISSCNTQHSYHHEKIRVKDNWANISYTNNQTAISFQNHLQTNWWENFLDPHLNYLVEKTIQNNPDIKIATARILEARADRALYSTAIIPNIDISQSTSSSKLTTSSNTTASKINLLDISLDASWEIDIFGTQSAVIASKDHLVNAYIADKQHVIMTLISEMIINYAEYTEYKQLLELQKQSVESYKDELEIIKAKHVSGIAHEIELEESNANLLAQKAKLAALQIRMKKAEHRVEMLCGEQAGHSALLSKAARTPLLAEEIIINSPIDAIQDRPDVRKAFHQLLSKTSITKSAVSEQFPKLTLLGSFGYQDSNISSTKTAWSIAQSLVSPVLNFKKIRSNINMKKAQEEQAFLYYQKTILNVIEEVESGLVRYYNTYNEWKTLQKTIDSRKHAVELSEHLYEHETSNYISILKAKRKLFEAQSQFVTSTSNLLKSSIGLYKALGYKVSTSS